MLLRIHDIPGVFVKERYNSYYYALSETTSTDDTKPCMIINQPLFVQLCVQASQANIDQTSFHELLTKIRAGVIQKDTEIIRLTEKDAKHRLLSYIPKGEVHLLINKKKATLLLYAKRQPTSVVFPGFTLGRQWAGGATKPTELEITMDYTFESDPEHHAKIVAEFNALLMLEQ